MERAIRLAIAAQTPQSKGEAFIKFFNYLSEKLPKIDFTNTELLEFLYGATNKHIEKGKEEWVDTFTVNGSSIVITRAEPMGSAHPKPFIQEVRKLAKELCGNVISQDDAFQGNLQVAGVPELRFGLPHLLLIALGLRSEGEQRGSELTIITDGVVIDLSGSQYSNLLEEGRKIAENYRSISAERTFKVNFASRTRTHTHELDFNLLLNGHPKKFIESIFWEAGVYNPKQFAESIAKFQKSVEVRAPLLGGDFIEDLRCIYEYFSDKK